MNKHRNNHISPAFYLMVVPVAALFFLLHTVPFLKGIFYSFTNWKGYGNWEFIGFKNFLQFFKDPSIKQAYGFTFQFALPPLP